MPNLDELIAEAEEFDRHPCDPQENYLKHRLADALEAVRAERDALTQRVRRLKNRELRATEKRDAALARIAELEDIAETHAFCADRLFFETDRLQRAEARIAEAAKLHRPLKHWNSDREYVFVCDECTRINRYGIAQWPCPTAVALGLNEGGSNA